MDSSPEEFAYFCDSCAAVVHGVPTRTGHPLEKVTESTELELLSVICFETNHYVCFARSENQWVFFDSMGKNRICKLYVAIL